MGEKDLEHHGRPTAGDPDREPYEMPRKGYQ